MNKKLVSLLLALLLVVGLMPAASAADLSEEANLVFYVMGDAPADEVVVEDAINAILKEKFNATVDFQFSTWTDFTLRRRRSHLHRQLAGLRPAGPRRRLPGAGRSDEQLCPRTARSGR